MKEYLDKLLKGAKYTAFYSILASLPFIGSNDGVCQTPKPKPVYEHPVYYYYDKNITPCFQTPNHIMMLEQIKNDKQKEQLERDLKNSDLSALI